MAAPAFRAVARLRASAIDASAVMVIVATIALVVFHYLLRADVVGVFSLARGWEALTARPLSPALHFAASSLILAVIPVVAARLLGVGFKEMGLGLGRWRVGLVLLVVFLPVAILAGKVGANSLAIRSVYPLDTSLQPNVGAVVGHSLTQFLYFGAWEILFRGVLCLGLAGRIGAGRANALQTALSVVAHFGRPMAETIGAIPAGLIFGWVDLKVKSVWYVAVLHWVVGVSVDVFILLT